MDLLKSLIVDWQNAVFSASIIFWVIYLFFVMQSGVSESEVGPDFSHDPDHDVGVDHDMNHDFDHDADVDMGAGHHGTMENLLSFLGVGRCPLSIILMTFGIIWGFIGLCCNGVFSSLIFIPAGLYFWPSLFVATFLGLIATRFVSLRVAKWLPRQGSSVVSLNRLVGRTGETSVMVDARSGRARVLDEHGTLHNIYCMTGRDDEPIPENKQIIVLQYIPTENVFVVQEKPVLPELQR